MPRLKTICKGFALIAFGVSISGVAWGVEGQGDPEKGEKVFRKCKACHTVEEGGGDRIGPNLHDIFERGIAAKEGYNYSDGMKGYATTAKQWTGENLDAYLENPRKVVPGTNMAFAGLRKESDRQDLIAYLEQATRTAE